MNKGHPDSAYFRAERETPVFQIYSQTRKEPSLEEARVELAESLSRVVQELLRDKYGPLAGAISKPTILDLLLQFEASIDRAKSDITLVLQELSDRYFRPLRQDPL